MQHQHNALLSSLGSVGLNEPKFIAAGQSRFTNTPQLAMSKANLYKLRLQAQVQLQTQQIDGAIQLLKMQYDSIMKTIQSPCTSPVYINMPQNSSIATVILDQASFAAKFALPSLESRVEVFETIENSAQKKRVFSKSMSQDSASRQVEQTLKNSATKRVRLQ